MAYLQAPWEKYLEKNTKYTGQGKPLPTRYSSNVPMTDAERLKAQTESNQLIAESLGVESTGKPSKGILQKSLEALGFVQSVASSAGKEFIHDPLYQLSHSLANTLETFNESQGATTPGFLKSYKTAVDAQNDKNAVDYKVSIQQFKDNVKARKFTQDLYPALQYGKDANIFEKGLKEIVGFGGDVVVLGGFGTGLRAGTALSKGAKVEMLGRKAEEVFVANASKLGLTAEAANDASRLFSGKVADALINGRSGAVAKVFEKELDRFDEAGNLILSGKDIFKSLPKELQGGLQLVVGNKVKATVNSGGYAVEAVAKALGLKGLPKATEWAVQGYQKIPNSIRADAITNPKVASAVGKINNVLNSLGGLKGTAYQSLVKASVNKAKDEDIATAFQGYKFVSEITRLRDKKGLITKETDDLIADLAKLKIVDEEAHTLAYDLMKNPNRIPTFKPTTEAEVKAIDFANIYHSELARYRAKAIAAGFDVEFLDEYLPIFFAAGDDFDKFAVSLKAGAKNVPGKGQQIDIKRTKYIKDKVDEFGNKVLDENGNTITAGMTYDEAKQLLIKEGKQEQADLIIDDPILALSRYANNVSRLVANKNVVTDALSLGVLFRSNILQVGLNVEKLVQSLGLLKPNQLDDLMTEFIATPGAVGNYTEKINDLLIKAYSSNDETLIAEAEGKIGALVESLTSVKQKTNYKKKRLEDDLADAIIAKDSVKQNEIKSQLQAVVNAEEYFKVELKKIGVKGQRILQEENKNIEGFISAQTLAKRQGIEYRPVGKSDLAKDKTFYLPDDLAELHGDKAIVELIDRYVLLGNKPPSELVKMFDSFTQWFRSSATFGRLTGFVLRNGYGAVQNNFLIAGSNGADHIIAKDVMTTILHTDLGLTPFQTLTRKDLISKRIQNLAKDGELTDIQTNALKADLEKYGFIRTNTLDTIREDILKTNLSLKGITVNEGFQRNPLKKLTGKEATTPEELTQYDVYQAMKTNGLFDEYNILQASANLNIDDQYAQLLNKNNDRIVIRTDRIGKDRKWAQKIGEGTLNIGFTIKADVFGREIKLRPVQFTKDANKLLEEFVRGAPIVTGLRKYGNSDSGVNAAGLLMKAAQFDYNDLSAIERDYMRRIIPFYTYMRKNLAAQTRLLANDPARIASNLRGWNVVQDIFSDPEGNTYAVPDYIGEMFGFVIDDNIRKDIIKKSPSWLGAVLGSNPIAFKPESPVFDLERFTQGGVTQVLKQQFIGSSNPLLKEILQFTLEENLFKNKKYSANGVSAPSWYVGMAKVLEAVPGVDFKIRKDPNSQELVTDEKFLDAFRTVLPFVGTAERTYIPVIEAVINTISGNNVDIAGKYNEKALTSIISQFLGIGTSTITPDTEIATYYQHNGNIMDNIKYVAGDKNIDIRKIREYANNLITQGYPDDEIVKMLHRATNSGMFAPDVVG